MPAHVMLSYQWDDQALVKKVHDRLRDQGLPVWMDIEGGVTGNINDSMAAGVEEAAIVCPFMTPAYQASRSCKKELSYADAREVTIVPVMLAEGWEASEWLGLITAGLLWVDFRGAGEDEELLERSIHSLVEELMLSGGPLLAAEGTAADSEGQTEQLKSILGKKPGRGFRQKVTKLYMCDSDGQLSDCSGPKRNTVELHETVGDHCYWREVKGNGCKYYRNLVTNRYLGFDSINNEVYSALCPSVCEEWHLLVDPTDQSRQRAIVIKNKHSGSFLAVRGGRLVGAASYNEDCQWILV